MNLKNKVIIVTGASHGIGSATALEFASAGAKVVLNYNHNKSETEDVQKEIETMGREALLIQADVGKQNDVDRLFGEVLKKFGNIDILVNNASYSKPGDFLEGDLKLWQELWQNNFMSTVLCSKQFAQINKGKQEKKIINIGSLFGFDDKADEGMMVYAASKAAVHNFTKTLTKLLAPGILVNAVAPGNTLTPQCRNSSERFKTEST